MDYIQESDGKAEDIIKVQYKDIIMSLEGISLVFNQVRKYREKNDEAHFKENFEAQISLKIEPTLFQIDSYSLLY